MRKLIVVWVVLSLLTAAAPGCTKPAMFSISNLTLTPQEVETDQRAAVSVDVTNTGGAEGSYTVILKLDGTEAEEQQVAIGPGDTRQATISVTSEKAGSYAIDVNGLAATLVVKEPSKPADFQLANLVISPDEMITGNSSQVSVDVTNIGEETGKSGRLPEVWHQDVQNR